MLALFLRKSVALSSPGRSDDEFGASASSGAEEVAAVLAADGGLGVGEDRGDFRALLAPDVEEVGVGRLYQSLKFVHVLLLGGVTVQKVDFHL